MKLSEIIENAGVVRVVGTPDREIVSITADSRKVVPGSLFIAVKGFASDGHAYIASALEKGAAAILFDNPEALSGERVADTAEPATWVQVGNSRHALGIAADNFFGHPSSKLTLVGITGTNGKTTTVTLLYHLFMGLGYNCGLLSTIAKARNGRRRRTRPPIRLPWAP